MRSKCRRNSSPGAAYAIIAQFRCTSFILDPRFANLLPADWIVTRFQSRLMLPLIWHLATAADGRAVVALREELDLVDAAAVAAELTAVAASEPGIIVNLVGLEFIDSSGVAALVRGRSQAWQAGGGLVLAAPQRNVIEVLAVTRLTDAFCVYATVEEAAGEPGLFHESQRAWTEVVARTQVVADCPDDRPADRRAAGERHRPQSHHPAAELEIRDELEPGVAGCHKRGAEETDPGQRGQLAGQ